MRSLPQIKEEEAVMSDKLTAFLAMVDTHADRVARFERDPNASMGDIGAAKAEAQAHFDREWRSTFVELVRVVQRLDQHNDSRSRLEQQRHLNKHPF
jgi:hypothetical protein